MGLNLSVKDINFIVCLWKYFNIFLITPWFNFDHNVLSNPNACKIFGTFLILLRIYWLIDSIILDGTMIQAFQTFLLTQKLNYILSTMILFIMTFLCIVKSAFSNNGNIWKNFFINFKYIDINLHNKGKTERKLWKNFYTHFLLCQMIFMLVLLYQMGVWANLVKIQLFSGIWLGPATDMFYKFQSIILISSILLCFKSRYKDLNYNLLQCHDSQKPVQEYQNLVYCHRILGENIDVFNNLYGYHILLVLFHIGLQLVGSLNLPFAFVTSLITINLDILICNFSLLAIFLVSVNFLLK